MELAEDNTDIIMSIAEVAAIPSPEMIADYRMILEKFIANAEAAEIPNPETIAECRRILERRRTVKWILAHESDGKRILS